MADPETSSRPEIPLRAPFAIPPNPPTPIFYFNGFALQYGTGDFTLTLKVDNQQQLALKMSYTVGKTLSQALAQLVEDFERITAHDVMTSEQVRSSLQEQRDNVSTRSAKSSR